MASRRDRSEFPTEAAWGRAVRDWLGEQCAVCGQTNPPWLQADHIIPRAQGGLNDLYNGWVVCGVYGCAFHLRLTLNEVLIDPHLLTSDHLDYLAEHRYLRFDDHGQPIGRGWRRFLAW